MAEPGLGFAGLLRQLRGEAGLTQEELAEAAGLSPRSVSDLERGIHATAHKDTAGLLAGALSLAGPGREQFVAAARGRSPAAAVLAAMRGAAGAFAAAATRGLPRDIAAFTGRQAELAQLMGTLNAMAAAGGGVVGICAIDGMAGIGKTTFAVHAAHRLAGMFPDGQFFLPLHAHTAGQRPVEPADALASLLLTAGVPATQIPLGLEARAGRWRDQVAARKVLLLLDDAAGHEQVRPLLPGTAGSLVLVTSRRRLTALEDATGISLDTLAPAEAAALLARLAARPGISATDPAVGEISRLCGYLPLAIGMLASRLHHHPAWTASGLAAELAGARDRLALMHAENLSVAAAFGLSYTDLTGGQQRLFRRLGLVPGPGIDAYAAAALDDISLDTARRLLEELYDQHLIAEPAPGRYQLHDLLREHARALAADDDPAECGAATRRLLDYYLYIAASAGRHFFSFSGYRCLPTGEPPADTPDLSTLGQAAGWLETERANLHAAVDYAAAHGWTRQVMQIPAAMSGFLLVHGHVDQSAALHHTALAAARQAGDRRGQAIALSELGLMRMLAGDIPAAAASQARALELYRDIGDLSGQACALSQLGSLQTMAGDYPAAAARQHQALALARTSSDCNAEAAALMQLGMVQRLTGDYRAAAASQHQALALFRQIGNQSGLAHTLKELGVVQQETGDYPAAAASHRQALKLFCDFGDRFGQAYTLNDLGVVQQETGDYLAAAASQQQALKLFRDLGDPFGQAFTLNDLGVVQQETGDHPAAAASHQQALELFRDLGNRLGQAEALNRLGELSSRTSATQQACEHHTQALAIARDMGVPLEEARALAGIGHTHLHDGNPRQAAAHLRQALTIYQRIGTPSAKRVQETLDHHGLSSISAEPQQTAPSSDVHQPRKRTTPSESQ